MTDFFTAFNIALHRHDTETDRKAKFLILALWFLEKSSLLPEKLGRAGRDKWETYMENARWADLLEFAARDLSRSYLHLTAFFPRYPIDFWSLRTLDDETLLSLLENLDDHKPSDVNADQLYTLGVKLLFNSEPKDINTNILSKLSLDRNSRIIELPNGMGKPTMALLSLYPQLTISQSCQIFVSSVIAEALASWAAILCRANEDDNGRIIRIDEAKWLNTEFDIYDLVLVSDLPGWIKREDIERKFSQARIIEL